MKKRWIAGLFILGGGFLLFFLFRFVYGFVTYPDYNENQQDLFLEQSNYSNSNWQRKNYASFKQKSSDVNQSVTIDQKYEKKATLNTFTGTYDEDEAALRDTITSYNALVQYEDKSGLEGDRRLFLSIGVPPENFDAMIADVSKIGRLNVIQINKTDKTNEFQELNAKRDSLVKSRDSLYRLKSLNAKVEELVQLEEKILSLENLIQDLGVDLGQYDEENEFCTVDFTLTENIFKGKKIGLMQRVLVSFEWTIKYYFVTILTLFFGLLLLLVLFKLLEKLKVFKAVIEAIEKK
jgi:hypothetical protein